MKIFVFLGGNMMPYSLVDVHQHFRGPTSLHLLMVFYKLYEGWNFNSGDYLFTTDAQ